MVKMTIIMVRVMVTMAMMVIIVMIMTMIMVIMMIMVVVCIRMMMIISGPLCVICTVDTVISMTLISCKICFCLFSQVSFQCVSDMRNDVLIFSSFFPLTFPFIYRPSFSPLSLSLAFPSFLFLTCSPPSLSLISPITLPLRHLSLLFTHFPISFSSTLPPSPIFPLSILLHFSSHTHICVIYQY